ncbi:hypothetical protein EDC01DRAFT_779509 [Geopyxis carbonaria]|nr:hypothetical protein EDC01DRAFT_779509 [Geopyxis carbonaria]
MVAPTGADGLPPLAIDSDEDNMGSGSDGDAGSDTTSLGDWEPYVYENGRRYAALSDRYLHPTDDAEKARQNLDHHILTRLLPPHPSGTPALHTARLHRPRAILDLGTGTGTWALAMSALHPRASITGLDLAPLQPAWVPSNVAFHISDVERAPWTFAPASADYIHLRFLAGAIGDWPALLRRCMCALRPGGQVEVVDWDWGGLWTGAAEGGALMELPGVLGAAFGVDVGAVMEAVGFGVGTTRVWAPVGGWEGEAGWAGDGGAGGVGGGTGVGGVGGTGVGGVGTAGVGGVGGTGGTGGDRVQLGRDIAESWRSGIEGLVLRAATRVGWRREEVDVFVAAFRKEVAGGRKRRVGVGVRWVVGVKPGVAGGGRGAGERVKKGERAGRAGRANGGAGRDGEGGGKGQGQGGEMGGKGKGRA